MAAALVTHPIDVLKVQQRSDTMEISNLVHSSQRECCACGRCFFRGTVLYVDPFQSEDHLGLLQPASRSCCGSLLATAPASLRFDEGALLAVGSGAAADPRGG